MPVPKLILILLCLLFAAFSPDTESASPGALQSAEEDGANENIVFEDSSLEAEENIRFEPLDVPETDFTQAATEPAIAGHHPPRAAMPTTRPM